MSLCHPYSLAVKGELACSSNTFSAPQAIAALGIPWADFVGPNPFTAAAALPLHG